MTDLVDRARTAVTERAELPGMSLLEHLEELRKRIIHSGVYLIVAFFVAYAIREKLSAFMVKPITAALKAHNLDPHLVYLNPVDPFNFYIKISLVCGAIIASPFILFQVWLFIAPGLYRQEKRYILPFMSATVGSISGRRIFRLSLRLSWRFDFSHRLRLSVQAHGDGERIHRTLHDRDSGPGGHV